MKPIEIEVQSPHRKVLVKNSSAIRMWASQADAGRYLLFPMKLDEAPEEKPDILEMLQESNDALRSTYSIADREGRDTNWISFKNRIKQLLEKQHKILFKVVPSPAPQLRFHNTVAVDMYETAKRVNEAMALLKPEEKPMPIPSPLYPCHYCNEEYSWPAADLFWSENIKDWVCVNCWSQGHHDEIKGMSLAEAIAAYPVAENVRHHRVPGG